MWSANRLAVAALVLMSSAAHAQDAPPEAPPEPTAPVEPPRECAPASTHIPKAKPKDYPRLMQEARQAIEELRYADALLRAAAIGSDATPNMRVEALVIAAVVHLIEGRAAFAQQLLEELFFLAPGFAIDDPTLPPRVTKMFDEEAARPHKRAVALKLREQGDDERDWALTAGGASKRVDLACRGGGRGAFAPVGTTIADGVARFRLPNVGTFQCHAVALDGDGLPLGRFGTRDRPQGITTSERASPVTDSAWFWVALGGGVVAAAAGIVTAVVLAQPDEAPAAELTVNPQAHVTATVLSW